MKVIIVTVFALAFAVGTFALDSKEENALAIYGKRSHPQVHTRELLIDELTEYSKNAGLASAKANMDKQDYKNAANEIAAHLVTIKNDPLVQPGKEYHMSYAMLEGCVKQFKSMYN